MKPTAGLSSTSAGEFIEVSRTLLADDYLPKLQQCAALLTNDDLWWRPNESSNSIGNMLLHLCGNLRDWIIGGVGGATIERDRPAEFSARASMSGDDLMTDVETTLRDVDRALADVKADSLLEQIEVQGFKVTRLQAIYHAIEHFGYHLGQVVYVTKLRTGKDLDIFP